MVGGGEALVNADGFGRSMASVITISFGHDRPVVPLEGSSFSTESAAVGSAMVGMGGVNRQASSQLQLPAASAAAMVGAVFGSAEVAVCGAFAADADGSADELDVERWGSTPE
jgi:hypothetical protein